MAGIFDDIRVEMGSAATRMSQYFGRQPTDEQMALREREIAMHERALEDQLRRQRADDLSRELIGRSLGMGPQKFNAFMMKQDLTSAALQQREQGLRVTSLGIEVEEQKRLASMTPMEREQEQFEAFFGGMTGALKGLFGDAKTVQHFTQQVQGIQMAQQAEAFQKDQALEEVMGQINAMSAQAGGPRLGLDEKRDAKLLMDSLIGKGVPAQTALMMTGDFLGGSSFGAPASPDAGPGGLARLPPGGVPRGFGAEAFAASQPGEGLPSMLSRWLSAPESPSRLPELKQRISNPRNQGDARRIGLILRGEGIRTLKDLEALPKEKLNVLWQAIASSD